MSAELLVAALVLDLLLADPRGWPHPVVWIGRLITLLEEELRARMDHDYWAGLLLVVAVVGLSGFAALSALDIFGRLAGWLALLFGLWLAWNCLALRSLHLESKRVVEALEAGQIAEARQALAMIVGRETAQLDEQAILRATIETVAENASDGVIAPLFYLTLGGPVAGILYKAVNTLDSMIGYKNAHYHEFGRCAAKLDDLVNWIPARLSGLCLVAAARLCGLDGQGAWRILRRDAHKHASPNAGWPEAAVAGALGVQLGGEAVYCGESVCKPTLGDPGVRLVPGHYHRAIQLLYVATLIALLPALVLLGGLG